MKKTFGLILFIAFALAGCGLETKTLSQFYEKDLDDVNKIVIVDGSTGNKKTVTENEVIKEFLTEIKDIKFIPDENQEKRVGWRFSITLFQDDKPAFQFGLSEVNENYYNTEPDIYPIVENLYENLDVQEE